jgi:replication factor A1
VQRASIATTVVESEPVSTRQSEVASEAKKRISEVLGDVNEAHYTPIKTLNTYSMDWKIKARITKKHQKKPWKNAKSAGSLLNLELIDSYGTQVLATFFNDMADKWDEVLQEGNVYLFS